MAFDWKTFLYGKDQKFFGAPIGSWGTPEFGATEAYAQQLSGGQTTDLSNALNQPIGQTTNQNLGGGGGGGGGGITGGNGDIDSNGNPVNTSGGTSGGTVQGVNTGGPSGPSAEDMLRSYWNELDNSFNEAYNSLGAQKGIQEQMVGENYNQALSGLSSEEATNKAMLDTQTRKANEQHTATLKDLGENMRSQYQAGANYLGARGAGDSSASGMYSYALNKLGSKQRGNVMTQTRSIMNDIADRTASLQRLVTQEKGRLESEKNTNLLNVANWYQQGLQQIQNARSSNRAQMSAQLLQNALQEISNAKTNFMNKQNALQEWAVSNSKSLSELGANLKGITSKAIAQQMFQPISAIGAGAVSPTASAPVGYGTSTNNDEWWK